MSRFHPFHPKIGNRLGYTLVEVMLSVAIISVVASCAILVGSNFQQGAMETKLTRDVATINQALLMYRNSGGTLTGLTDPQDVIDRLKSKLSTDESVRMAGLRKGMIDPRLSIRLQTSVEAGSGEQRAYYNQDSKSFVIAHSGGQGVREFVLDESLALKDFGEDNRHSTFDLAKVNPWVWDYNQVAAPDKGGPQHRERPTATAQNDAPSTSAGALKLNPPTFSTSTGSFLLAVYPLKLELANPNPVGSSTVLYSVNSGDWRTYTDPLTVNPGEKIQGISTSLDPDYWVDSDVRTEVFTAKPVTPVLELVFDQDSYTYGDLGGPMIQGSAPAPVGGKYGTISLANASDIPLPYQSSEYFKVKWTLDGSPPVTSPTALTGVDFTGGFAAQRIPLKLGDYSTATSVVVNAASTSLNDAYFNPSLVVSKTLGIKPVTLRAPIVTVEDRVVTMTLDTQYTDIPVGARILYTLDGTEPGKGTGRLYTGSFQLTGTTGSTVTLTTRVYPPLTYDVWFLPSTSDKRDVTLPTATDFYIGGDFYVARGGGVGSRNLARLTSGGGLDPSFDVGAGASENSVVTVVRELAAGKVFAGGDFDSVNTLVRPAAVLLNADGSVDASFDAGLADGQ